MTPFLRPPAGWSPRKKFAFFRWFIVLAMIVSSVVHIWLFGLMWLPVIVGVAGIAFAALCPPSFTEYGRRHGIVK